MDELGGHQAKYNRIDRERQILHGLTFVGNLKKKKPKNQTTTKKELIETEQNGSYERWRGLQNVELLFKVLKPSVIR